MKMKHQTSCRRRRFCPKNFGSEGAGSTAAFVLLLAIVSANVLQVTKAASTFMYGSLKWKPVPTDSATTVSLWHSFPPFFITLSLSLSLTLSSR